jgi:hypothetical protein
VGLCPLSTPSSLHASLAGGSGVVLDRRLRPPEAAGVPPLLVEVFALRAHRPPSGVAQLFCELLERRLRLRALLRRQWPVPVKARGAGERSLDAVRTDRHRVEARPAPCRDPADLADRALPRRGGASVVPLGSATAGRDSASRRDSRVRELRTRRRRSLGLRRARRWRHRTRRRRGARAFAGARGAGLAAALTLRTAGRRRCRLHRLRRLGGPSPRARRMARHRGVALRRRPRRRRAHRGPGRWRRLGRGRSRAPRAFSGSPGGGGRGHRPAAEAQRRDREPGADGGDEDGDPGRSARGLAPLVGGRRRCTARARDRRTRRCRTAVRRGLLERVDAPQLLGVRRGRARGRRSRTRQRRQPAADDACHRPSPRTAGPQPCCHEAKALHLLRNVVDDQRSVQRAERCFFWDCSSSHTPRTMARRPRGWAAQAAAPRLRNAGAGCID